MNKSIVWRVLFFTFILGCGDKHKEKNHAPVAGAGGPYAGAEDFPLELDGSRSDDADNDSLVYTWDFGDGTKGEGVKPLHIYTEDGNFSVCLTVSDGQSISSPSCTTAAIFDTDLNFPPVAQAGEDKVVDLGAEAVFDGSSSYDFDGEIASYSWDFGDGVSGEGAVVTHTYMDFGTYTAVLTVADDKGAQTADTLLVAVVDTEAQLTVKKIVVKDTEPEKPYHVSVEVVNTGTVPIADALFRAEIHDSCQGHHIDWGLTDQYVSFEVGEERDVAWNGKVPAETEPGDYFAQIEIFFSGKVLSSSANFVVE